MKKLSIAFCVVLFASFFCGNIFGQSKSDLSLTGDGALNQIKQDGSYDSFVKAVKSVRGNTSLTDGNQTDDAIGQSAKLTASDAASGDFFGYSVAIDGDMAIVGAFGDDNFTGSAYIFIRIGTSWTFAQKLTASNASVEQYFGYSVDIDNETLIIGAFGENGLSGAAYVFTKGVSGWTEQQMLTANDFQREDSFGWRVSVKGNTALIGAYGDDNFRGSAYIFTRTNGVWSQQQKLTDVGRANDDQFGWSVTLTDTTAVIAARLDDDVSNDAGSVFVYINNGGNWMLQQKLTALDGGNSDSLDGVWQLITILS